MHIREKGFALKKTFQVSPGETLLKWHHCRISSIKGIEKKHPETWLANFGSSPEGSKELAGGLTRFTKSKQKLKLILKVRLLPLSLLFFNKTEIEKKNIFQVITANPHRDRSGLSARSFAVRNSTAKSSETVLILKSELFSSSKSRLDYYLR